MQRISEGLPVKRYCLSGENDLKKNKGFRRRMKKGLGFLGFFFLLNVYGLSLPFFFKFYIFIY